MIMEKRLRFVHIMACSNMNTRVQLTVSEDTDDLRNLIAAALKKVASFNTETEYYNIEHIDSISHLPDMDK